MTTSLSQQHCGQKILAAFIREVAAERPIVRLVPVPTDSLSASGKALIDGQVDLAVVRSDDAAAAQGRTVLHSPPHWSRDSPASGVKD